VNFFILRGCAAAFSSAEFIQSSLLTPIKGNTLHQELYAKQKPIKPNIARIEFVMPSA